MAQADDSVQREAGMDSTVIQDVEVHDTGTLQSLVSDQFGKWSEALVITQKMVDQFAELTGDRQWIHVDVERAKRESPFGGPIVHGFLLLSLMPSLRPPPGYRLQGYSSAANYGSSGLRFVSPVAVGKAVRSRQRLKRVEQHRRGTLLTSEVVIQALDSDRPALVYDLQVLYA